ncbi:ABC transporter substrate-binding protein [Microbacterium sp. RD1]|uniref:ABC transporter substrate-binding protein n=1 Tax=Microbacterium sp. RD1 TaxID=3457313 RepID=UPI003FA60C22
MNHHTHPRRAVALVGAAALVAALTGCATEASPSSSGSAENTEPLTLSIGVRNLMASSAPLYWAEAEGYFDDAGLDLNLVVGEAAQASQLVAGQTDLYWGGAQGGLFGIVNSGKPIHTIYGIDASSSAYVVTSNDAVKTPADCKTVTTAPAGTVMHAWTRQLERIYDVQWELTQLTTIPAILANVVADRTDCAIGNVTYYQSAIDDGTLRVILDPAATDDLPKDWPEVGVEDVVGGLPDVLESKRDAVELVLKTYNEALQDFIETDSTEIAETLHASDPAWAAAGSVEVLATSLDQFKNFLSPDDGYIAGDTWERTVDFFEAGGLDFLATDPSRFDYANSVDMSYFEEGIGKP